MGITRGLRGIFGRVSARPISPTLRLRSLPPLPPSGRGICGTPGGPSPSRDRRRGSTVCDRAQETQELGKIAGLEWGTKRSEDVKGLKSFYAIDSRLTISSSSPLNFSFNTVISCGGGRARGVRIRGNGRAEFGRDFRLDLPMWTIHGGNRGRRCGLATGMVDHIPS